MQVQVATTPMTALLQPTYGLPDVLKVAVVDAPALREDSVLVRVVAASLNKGDWHLLTGTPYLVRLMGYGLQAPTRPIPGMAIAGRVEAVGAKVNTFKPGDEVFGEINRGGFAEYVSVGAHELARKPAGVTFEDAATIPVASTTALQGLRDSKLQRGQSVLINGGSSGVGAFAVQIAKSLGAEVTAVCSSRNVDFVRALGADHVIDYTKEDFTTAGRRYDVIFDLVGNHPLAALRGALTEKGRLLACAGGAENTWVGPMFGVLSGVLSNAFSNQKFVPVANAPNAADLATVAGMFESGAIRSVIQDRLTLAQVPDAMVVLGQGRMRGKSVVSL